MQKQTEQALKKAFIKQHHADTPAITLGIFAKELEDDVEMAQWIYSECGHDYPEHIQMHMRNLLDAQLKQNAGIQAVLQYIVSNVAEANGLSADELFNKLTQQPAQQDVEQEAKQATDALLTKMRLH